MRKAATTLLSLVIALAGQLAVAALGPGSPAHAAPRTELSAKSPEVSARTAREPLRRWRCTRWKGSSAGGSRTCVKLDGFSDKVKIDYRERFYNGTDRRGTVTCSHARTTTWTMSVSATVESEAGAIFAKLKASVTAGVSRSSSTTRTTSVAFPHPARSWVHCERGLHGFSFRGVVRRQYCNASGCRNTDKAFRGNAPEAGFWRYGNGRGAEPVTP